MPLPSSALQLPWELCNWHCICHTYLFCTGLHRLPWGLKSSHRTARLLLMAFLTIYLLALCRPRSTFVLVCMRADPARLLVTRCSRRCPSPQHLLHTYFIRTRWPTPVCSSPAARTLGPRPMCACCGPPCAQSSLPPSPAWLSIPAPCAPNCRCSCARCPLLLCSIYALPAAPLLSHCTVRAQRSFPTAPRLVFEPCVLGRLSPTLVACRPHTPIVHICKCSKPQWNHTVL
jgi:hypothetical protein